MFSVTFKTEEQLFVTCVDRVLDGLVEQHRFFVIISLIQCDVVRLLASFFPCFLTLPLKIVVVVRALGSLVTLS